MLQRTGPKGLGFCILNFLIIFGAILMFKQSVRTLSIIAALFSIHTAASATCVGTDCKIDVDGSFDFDLGNDVNGIYLQKNVGHSAAHVNLNNVVMRDNGGITGTATAIGNNAGFSFDASSSVPLKHISQSAQGDRVSTVNLTQNRKSVTGEVTLESISVGNNLSITLDNTSLSELSVAQCNKGNSFASTTFSWDPTKLTASATAIGNNISVGVARP